VAVPGIRVDGGDDPVLGHLPDDPEHPVDVLVEVLADHGGQQRGRLRHPRLELPTVEGAQQRPRVPRRRVHQRLTGRPVLPVTDRLPGTRIAVAAAQQPAQLTFQLGVGRLEQPADRRPDHGDGVHRGDRVIQRGGVQHRFPSDQPGLRRLQRHLEDPVRPGGGGQPGTHVHQHRVHERRTVEVQPARGVLPPRVEDEPVRRLPVRAPLDPLQHHHHRHDHRRHRTATHIGEQISEQLIREQVEALPMQHPVDRVRRHPALAQAHRRPQQIPLPRRPAPTSSAHPSRSHHIVTIPPKQSPRPGHRHAKTPRS
jgi:hypothetical protein